MPDQLRATPQTIRTRLADLVAGAMRPIVGDERHAYRIADRVTSALDWAPGLGNLMGAQEAAQQAKRGYRSGNLADLALGAGGVALSVLPGGRKVGEMGAAVARGVRAPLRDNYLTNLKSHAQRIYRETSPDQAGMFIPHSNTVADTRRDLFFADSPDLALGQGPNRGVLLEFDSDGIQGQVSKAKPTWEHEWGQGRAEYIAKYNQQSVFQNNLRAITIKPDVKFSPAMRERMSRTIRALEQSGWSRSTAPDGSIVVRR